MALSTENKIFHDSCFGSSLRKVRSIIALSSVVFAGLPAKEANAQSTLSFPARDTGENRPSPAFFDLKFAELSSYARVLKTAVPVQKSDSPEYFKKIQEKKAQLNDILAGITSDKQTQRDLQAKFQEFLKRIDVHSDPRMIAFKKYNQEVEDKLNRERKSYNLEATKHSMNTSAYQSWYRSSNLRIDKTSNQLNAQRKGLAQLGDLNWREFEKVVKEHWSNVFPETDQQKYLDFSRTWFVNQFRQSTLATLDDTWPTEVRKAGKDGPLSVAEAFWSHLSLNPLNSTEGLNDSFLNFKTKLAEVQKAFATLLLTKEIHDKLCATHVETIEEFKKQNQAKIDELTAAEKKLSTAKLSLTVKIDTHATYFQEQNTNLRNEVLAQDPSLGIELKEDNRKFRMNYGAHADALEATLTAVMNGTISTSSAYAQIAALSNQPRKLKEVLVILLQMRELEAAIDIEKLPEEQRQPYFQASLKAAIAEHSLGPSLSPESARRFKELEAAGLNAVN